MLQACLNGGRSKSEAEAVPITADELARDAVAVRRSGARELHIHPRDDEGEETLAPGDVAHCLKAVRAAVPDMPLGVGTGAWIKPGGRARLKHIEEWFELADYASVNLDEEDALETMELLLSKGVGIEAGIWSVEDAERFLSSPFKTRCLRVLIEMITDDVEKAEKDYRAIRKIMMERGNTLPLLLHGHDASTWPMVELATQCGHDSRVGFEDSLRLPDGQIAESNAQMVGVATKLMDQGET